MNIFGINIFIRWYIFCNIAFFNESRRGSTKSNGHFRSYNIVCVEEVNNDERCNDIEHWLQGLGQWRSVVIDCKRYIKRGSINDSRVINGIDKSYRVKLFVWVNLRCFLFKIFFGINISIKWSGDRGLWLWRIDVWKKKYI